MSGWSSDQIREHNFVIITLSPSPPVDVEDAILNFTKKRSGIIYMPAKTHKVPVDKVIYATYFIFNISIEHGVFPKKSIHIPKTAVAR